MYRYGIFALLMGTLLFLSQTATAQPSDFDSFDVAEEANLDEQGGGDIGRIIQLLRQIMYRIDRLEKRVSKLEGDGGVGPLEIPDAEEIAFDTIEVEAVNEARGAKISASASIDAKLSGNKVKVKVCGKIKVKVFGNTVASASKCETVSLKVGKETEIDSGPLKLRIFFEGNKVCAEGKLKAGGYSKGVKVCASVN